MVASHIFGPVLRVSLHDEVRRRHAQRLASGDVAELRVLVAAHEDVWRARAPRGAVAHHRAECKAAATRRVAIVPRPTRRLLLEPAAVITVDGVAPAVAHQVGVAKKAAHQHHLRLLEGARALRVVHRRLAHQKLATEAAVVVRVCQWIGQLKSPQRAVRGVVRREEFRPWLWPTGTQACRGELALSTLGELRDVALHVPVHEEARRAEEREHRARLKVTTSSETAIETVMKPPSKYCRAKSGKFPNSVIGHRFGVTAPIGRGCPAAWGQMHLTGYGKVC